YEGQILVLYVVRDQVLMQASYHAGFKKGIPHSICATKPVQGTDDCGSLHVIFPFLIAKASNTQNGGLLRGVLTALDIDNISIYHELWIQ
ncbi:MAG: hypothetical protein MJH10_18555, partial [Epibacterium sp.]|nr:hypothetical protein [Epibacterium sp.]